MKLLSILAVFGLLFTMSGCPKKQVDAEQTSSEPVEGSSAPAKADDSAGTDEMQEKKGDSATEPTAAPAEEKKEAH